MKHTDLGIVLQKRSYSESSVIVQILTKDLGVRSFIFKGAKKKGQQLFPLALVELTYYSRKESDLLQLTDATPTEAWSFPFHPIRSALAFFCCEVLYHCVKHEQQDGPLFSFIVNYIDKIEHDDIDVNLPLVFTFELTKMLGFGPLLETENPTAFDLPQGSFIIAKENLERNVHQGKSIELLINIAQDKPLMNSNKKVRKSALSTMLDYYKIHVPGFKELKSLQVLETLLND